jgi:ABC-type transport system involved in multi-copper enzyme maturation permease subunit
MLTNENSKLLQTTASQAGQSFICRLQNILFIAIGVLISTCAIFFIWTLRPLSVLLGIGLFAIGLMVVTLEFTRLQVIVEHANFWFTSVLVRSLVLTFVSLVAIQGQSLLGCIALLLSLGLSAYGAAGGIIPEPLLNKDFRVIMDTSTLPTTVK